MSRDEDFRRVVSEAMLRRGLGLRELCRRAGLDPSLLSKILSGKRPPPGDEDALTRLARELDCAPVELIVAAGVIPRAWAALSRDPSVLKAVDALARGESAPRAAPGGASGSPAVPPRPAPSPELSEELL